MVVGSFYVLSTVEVYMNMTINGCSKYRKIAGKYYLIPVGKAAEKWETPLQLTETAALIWTMLEEGQDKDVIIKKMTEEFEVDSASASAAVENFYSELLRQGFLDDSVSMSCQKE